MHKKRRYGCFYLHRLTIEDEPGFVTEVLAEMKFLPLRVESHYDRDAILYFGMSPRFDEINLGTVVPEYYLTFEAEYNAEENKNRLTSWTLDKQ